MSLYKTWKKAHRKEYPNFYDFVANRRKAETGYKGEFVPEFGTMKMAELREIAEEKGIDVKGLTRKDDVIKALEGENENE